MSNLFLRNNSDRSWNWFGQNDPYYGVLTDEQFRQGKLTEEALRVFFDSGDAHVKRVFGVIAEHFGGTQLNNCLDFGCGVGRLVIPLARRFKSVSGVDISPAMIAEAVRNCERFDVHNASFHSQIAEIDTTFDLVHSYIVIQHIPVARGLRIIDELIGKLRPSGVAFLHITIGRQAGLLRDIATVLRKNIGLLHRMLNVVEKKPANTAYMQMNAYQLNPIFSRLYRCGIQKLWVEIEKHGDSFSVCLVFRK